MALAADDSQASRDAAVDRFFTAARQASTEGRFEIVVPSAEVIAIADDADLRRRFRDSYKKLNDAELQAVISDYLGALINRLERTADRADLRVDLVDRAGLAPSATIAVAGLLALVGTGGAAAPFLLGGGIIGIIASGGGRTLVKSAGNRDRHAARQVTLLRDALT